MQGIFITFEGCDGAGKSSQSAYLRDYLKGCGFDVLLIRDPGSTSIGEKIRSVIIDPENREMSPMTEALLYAAARAQMITQVIAPAIEEGKIVICDRFIDSNLAYQGEGRGLGFEKILSINSHTLIWPDITFYIKLSPEEGLLRKSKDGAFDRMEREDIKFHNLVFEGYNKIADTYDRIETIDGSLSAKDISNIIVSNVMSLINRYNKEEWL